MNGKPYYIYAVLLDMQTGSDPLRVIRFDLDSGKDFWCPKSRTSYNAFQNGLRGYIPKYNKRFKKQKYLWSLIPHHQWTFNRSNVGLHAYGNFPEDKIEILSNIWEFYKEAGYDYKNKKWDLEKYGLAND